MRGREGDRAKYGACVRMLSQWRELWRANVSGCGRTRRVGRRRGGGAGDVASGIAARPRSARRSTWSPGGPWISDGSQRAGPGGGRPCEFEDMWAPRVQLRDFSRRLPLPPVPLPQHARPSSSLCVLPGLRLRLSSLRLVRLFLSPSSLQPARFTIRRPWPRHRECCRSATRARP